jgi:cytochrome c oxidase assembly protein subunit 15
LARVPPQRDSRDQAAPVQPRARRKVPRVSPELGHKLDLLALVLVALIVVTGGAVRLTGSGLGCSDWPECSVGHLTPALQFHGLVEFGNRLVTVVLTIAVAAAFLVAIFRSPRRRDLVWLSGGLVAGVLAQAVLGGIVVYTKLNPYVVMVHFVATILLVADAVVLVHRDRLDYSPGAGRLLVPRTVIRAFYGLLALLALVITAGTAVTGAGPHAGDSSGQQVARRIPIALRDMAELHSSLALLMVGLTVGLVVALHASSVPSRVQRSARILLVVMVAQAAIGYTQYFTHLPALLVELHLAGATALAIGMIQTFLVCTYHPKERVERIDQPGRVDRVGQLDPPAEEEGTELSAVGASPPDGETAGTETPAKPTIAGTYSG